MDTSLQPSDAIEHHHALLIALFELDQTLERSLRQDADADTSELECRRQQITRELASSPTPTHAHAA